MLSASSCGARSPLSPLTQSTLEKHLPGLTPKRFLQQKKRSTADVGCITGRKFEINLIKFALISTYIGKIEREIDLYFHSSARRTSI